MNSRFHYEEPKMRDNKNDDTFIKYSYEKKIVPISSNKDGSIDKYVEETFFKEEKCSMYEYMKSFSLGSVQEQVMNHLTKGTPLITAHVLPDADYTKLSKGAEIRHEMAEKGLTFDAIVQAVKEAIVKQEAAAADPAPAPAN